MRERIARLTVPLARRLGPPLAVGLVLGLLGPFGTYDRLPAGPRLAYWLAVVSANWLLADAILRRVGALAVGRLPIPGLSVPLAGALAAAVPGTGIVALAGGVSGLGWPQSVPVLFAQVLLLMAAVSLPVHAWEVGRERSGAGPEAPAPVPAPSPAPDAPGAGAALFSARLPGPVEGGIRCLEMQDHYLVVHGARGSVMILCRMEDAARELEGLGRRVHRSWWVAAAAVEGAEREGQRTFLRLRDGRRVPVGRSFRPDLKAVGWL